MPHFFSQQKSRRTNTRCAFSLVELLVCIAVIGILSAIIIPVVSSVRLRSLRVQCTANLRSIGQGMMFFLNENNNFFPGPGTGGGDRPYLRISSYMGLDGELIFGTSNGVGWRRLRDGYELSPFHTPFADPREYTKGSPTYINEFIGLYGLNLGITYYVGRTNNMYGASLEEIAHPARTVLAGEHYAKQYNGSNIAGHLSNVGLFPQAIDGLASNYAIEKSGTIPKGTPHGPANVLFVDGHVETVDVETLTPFPSALNTQSRIIFTP